MYNVNYFLSTMSLITMLAIAMPKVLQEFNSYYSFAQMKYRCNDFLSLS